MKILIIGFAKLRIMSYLNLYLNNIDLNANDVSVLYWNRDNIEEDTSNYPKIRFWEFKCYQEDEVAKIYKFKSFLRYRRYVKRVLKLYQYERIVVLHSLPGILLLDLLVKKYSHRYILDYRDSTFEGIAVFRKALGILIKHSIITLTSSNAFRVFFPPKYESKIFTTHNILEDSLLHRDYERIPSEKIRVAFWGMIRHEEVNKAIILRLANDDRYELHYYGREQSIANALKKYTGCINARNVFFHGAYTATDRYEFARQTDIIHNIYYDNNTMLAMGNKYYDGLIFRIPQVCMPGSFMGKLCVEKSVGVTLSPFDHQFADELYKYYVTICQDDFNMNADLALSEIIEEYHRSVREIKNSLM